jgi:PEP-CTERM motif
MGRSPVFFILRLTVVGLLLASSSLLLAPMASADSFTSTFNLGSINVSDSSAPPAFLSGPFNYGFSLLGLDPTVAGQVAITNISVSTNAVLNSTNPGFGNATGFNWAIFVGPSPFGFTPGQVNGTSVLPDSITSNAPTQFQFAQTGATGTLTGSYNFVSNTFQTSTGGTTFPAPHATFTSPGAFGNGLYAQVFLWTEAGDNLDFNNVTVTVNGNATPVPEPSSMLLLGTGALSLMGVLRRKLIGN